MTRRVPGLALLVCLPLCLGACATGSGGRAEATMASDGSIIFQAKRHGLFGRAGQSVVFKPGEPGYEAMKAQVEVLGTGARRPVLTWTIGEPELIPPPGR